MSVYRTIGPLFYFQVIARIFYCINRSWTGRITIQEMRKSNFLQVRLFYIHLLSPHPRNPFKNEEKKYHILVSHQIHYSDKGERIGLVIRVSDSGSGDLGWILGRVCVLFP